MVAIPPPGAAPISSRGDLTFASDSDASGAGDLIFKAGGVERARITAAGVGSGLLAASKSRQDILMAGLGFVSWNWPPQSVANQSALTAGKAHTGVLPLVAGDIVNNIICEVNIVAAGTAPTAFYVYLLDKTGKCVSISTDLKASASLTTLGFRQFPITRFVAPTTDDYYPVLLQVGAWGTTQPAFARNNGNNPGAALSGGIVAWGHAGTGLTVPTPVGNTVAITADALAFFFGVN